jgi:nucleoside-diphosphate-sugar epimerase
MRVLLTGHDGYLGAVAVPRFLAAGHQVVGLDCGYYRDCRLFGAPPPIPVIDKDLRDLSVDDVRGFDAVVHFGALSNDPVAELDPALTRAINGAASLRLAELAKEAGVRRFLFSSSCSVYGTEGAEARTETSALDPQTEYARSKIASERAIAPLADDRFSPTFLRNATAYGLSPKLRFDLVVNNFVGWAVTTGQIKVMSDGTPWRPLIHADDIATTFLAVLAADRSLVHNEVFNVGRNDANYRVRDIAETVARVIPGCEVVFAGGASPDTRSYRVDFSKLAARLPNLSLRWTVEGGVRQLHEALQRRGLTLDEFQGPRFTRIKELQRLRSAGLVDDELRWSKKAQERSLAGARA